MKLLRRRRDFENSEAEKECRRCSIRRVLSRIGGSDQGPQFESFRDCICVFECSKWVRATSRSSSNLCVCLKPFNIFFLSRFLNHRKWICDTETRKIKSKCESHPYWGLELNQSWSRLKFGLPAGHFVEPSCKRNLPAPVTLWHTT